MDNHYQTLGINSSATLQEIRRAYRILARRYHPDLNPGKSSEEKFKAVATAYSVLSDPALKEQYDIQLESAPSGSARSAFGGPYENAQRAYQRARRRFDEEKLKSFGKGRPESEQQARPSPESAPTRAPSGGLAEQLKIAGKKLRGLWPFSAEKNGSMEHDGTASTVSRLSIIEVSVSIKDAITGIKKTVEIAEPEGTRKVSVRIPPGVRNGSVVRLRAKGSPGEDLVLVVRVASHPFLSIHNRGLVAEIPVTVQEAVVGASITVPTLEEPVILKIPPNAQSGLELRLKEKGMLQKDGTRGDLFFRLLVQVPESQHAVGIKEKVAELDKYYESPVRRTIPKSLLES